MDGTPRSSGDVRTDPQLTHLALGVSDLDASVAFYSDFCGMVLVHKRESGGVRVAWLGDPAAAACGGEGDFVLVLAEGLSPNAPLGPFAHLGFAVPSRDAVDDLAARGRGDGILALAPTFEGPIVGYICEVFDPDGNVCEFSFGQSLGRHAPLS
ncbi:MAG: VOC family protein [Acidimicrobiia bacterium]|nr:VOC family protein [Acidimicrobiia bacterium]